MNTLHINGIHTQAIIGVFDWERTAPRPLTIDLRLTLNPEQRFNSDDLTQTVDYKSLTDTTRAIVETSEYQLIETLAEYLAECLLAEFTIHSIEVTVHKPGILPRVDDVSITLLRHQHAP